MSQRRNNGKENFPGSSRNRLNRNSDDMDIDTDRENDLDHGNPSDLFSLLSTILNRMNKLHKSVSELRQVSVTNPDYCYKYCDRYVSQLKESSSNMKQGLSSMYNKFFDDENKLHKKTVEQLELSRKEFRENVNSEVDKLKKK